MNNEPVFFHNAEVTVSRSRLIVSGKVVALQSIVSYEIRRRPLRGLLISLLLLTAGGLSLTGPGGWLFAGAAGAWAAYFIFRQRPYRLIVTTADGDVVAVTSKEISGVVQVRDAIGAALAAS